MGFGFVVDTTVVTGATTTIQATSNDWKMTLVVGMLNLAFVLLRLYQEERKNKRNRDKDARK